MLEMRSQSLGRLARAAALIAASWLFEAGCSSETKLPDAARIDVAPSDVAADVVKDSGSDLAPDAAATDVVKDSGSDPEADLPPDAVAADVVKDSSADYVDPPDEGGADTGNPCFPPCTSHILGGCSIEGTTCIVDGANYCYSNGVKAIVSPPGGLVVQTITKNGVFCAKNIGGTYYDASGATLGWWSTLSDGITTYYCTGYDPEPIPATCKPMHCEPGICEP